jgi:hypothetical protein
VSEILHIVTLLLVKIAGKGAAAAKAISIVFCVVELEMKN